MSPDENDPVPRRLPAQYGRTILRSHAQRALMGLAGLFLVGVFAAMTWGWRSWTAGAVDAVLLTVMVVGDRVLSPRLDDRERGNLAEMKVAGILESMENKGWRTLHDVSCGRGNIDHL